MSRLLLIDAYAHIYRAYYAFINSPIVNSKQQNTSAVFGFCNTLDDLIKRINPTHIAVAFDSKGNTFRHDIFPEYKAQRAAAPEDIHNAVPIIKDILKARNITIIAKEGYEADDIIGTLARQLSKQVDEVYMATPDKDYGQLIDTNVFMYRPRHNGGYEKLGVQEVCAKYEIQSPKQMIDYLGLMGDASDNIPGCPGVGPKTAVKLLQQFGSIDDMLQRTSELKGSQKEKIESNAEMIRLSKYLVTINTEVPIDIHLQQLAIIEPNITDLATIYKELEFNSLLRGLKLNEAETKPQVAKKQTDQLDLFATFDTPIAEDDNPKELTYQNISALQFAEITGKAEQVAMTITTKSEKIINAGIDSIQLSSDGKTIYQLQKSDIEQIGVIKCNWVGHDIKHQLMLLKQNNIAFEGKYFDTAIAHYLIQPELRHDIDSICETYLHRSNNNTYSTLLDLQPILEAEIDRLDMRYLLNEVELPLVDVLADMELAGVRMNTATLKQAEKQLNDELNQLAKDIQERAGQQFNINSPSQVGVILFDVMHLDPKAKKSKSGSYSTSEEVLIALKHKDPIVEQILEYRAIKKLLSTYIEALPLLINPQTGKIHTSYNQTITSTGRLSSSNPNLQNLPIRTERGKVIRQAVVPDDDCIFLSADYSQIELRIMAHLSQDEALLNAFHSNEDVHSATAAKINHIEIAEVTPTMRRQAKTANFGIIYGVSAFGLAERLDISRTEAKQLITDYFASFPRVESFIEEAKQSARDKGYAETLYHRRRYLPDIESRNPTVRSFAERNAVNAPIQGTAADIIKIAMVAISRRLKKENLKTQMIMQVHDELNFNVPKAEIEQVKLIVVEEMQNVVKLSVPLIVDCGIGENWLQAH
ncbi:MAG: DNA polymerase I [Paludibacteraceae bacterium]|nr:DNA polymerase I [Paludibacteraceae bacterium]